MDSLLFWRVELLNSDPVYVGCPAILFRLYGYGILLVRLEGNGNMLPRHAFRAIGVGEDTVSEELLDSQRFPIDEYFALSVLHTGIVDGHYIKPILFHFDVIT